jgi:hypothetical protein
MFLFAFAQADEPGAVLDSDRNGLPDTVEIALGTDKDFAEPLVTLGTYRPESKEHPELDIVRDGRPECTIVRGRDDDFAAERGVRILPGVGTSDYGGYQRMPILLAKNGMAALCYDPIDQGERHQLLGPDGKPRAEASTLGHSLLGVGSILLGRNTATFRI